jgi:hypothetical protein
MTSARLAVNSSSVSSPSPCKLASLRRTAATSSCCWAAEAAGPARRLNLTASAWAALSTALPFSVASVVGPVRKDHERGSLGLSGQPSQPHRQENGTARAPRLRTVRQPRLRTRQQAQCPGAKRRGIGLDGFPPHLDTQRLEHGIRASGPMLTADLQLPVILSLHIRFQAIARKIPFQRISGFLLRCHFHPGKPPRWPDHLAKPPLSHAAASHASPYGSFAKPSPETRTHLIAADECKAQVRC